MLGRRRALIKRGGAPLAPRELEEAAAGVPGVRIAAAVGLPPPAGAATETEEIALAVEVDPETDPRAVSGAVAQAVEAAAGFAPDRVVVMAPRSIPRTANGKIRHAVLREKLLEED